MDEAEVESNADKRGPSGLRYIAGAVLLSATLVLVLLYALTPTRVEFCQADQPIGLTAADYDNPPPGNTKGCWNKKVKKSIEYSRSS